jgi:hypothetical protein
MARIPLTHSNNDNAAALALVTGTTAQGSDIDECADDLVMIKAIPLALRERPAPERFQGFSAERT